MIQSMTGHGVAQTADGGVSYSVEIRSVNNRYLKVSIKLPEPLQFAETLIEKLLRTRLGRGSVDFALRLRTGGASTLATIHSELLQHYVDQLSKTRTSGNVQATIDLAVVAALPGVCQPAEVDDERRARLLVVMESLTTEALEALWVMRREEGIALRTDLLKSCDQIQDCLQLVSARAPLVVHEYHSRLKTRVETLLRSAQLELEQESLMREVAVFAERCDVSEEITRLTSHLQQFRELCDRGDQVGRTMDFLTQELLREANTVASKSNDAQISRCIVEVKGLIDRLREQVQNVE